jgi:hypothetical protein
VGLDREGSWFVSSYGVKPGPNRIGNRAYSIV